MRVKFLHANLKSLANLGVVHFLCQQRAAVVPPPPEAANWARHKRVHERCVHAVVLMDIGEACWVGIKSQVAVTVNVPLHLL